MGCRRALLVGRAETDHGPAGDHGRPSIGAGRFNGFRDGVLVMTVDGLHMPAGRLEPLVLVGRGGKIGLAVDCDLVVVPEKDQPAEAEMAREVDRLVADPLHQATVAGDHIGVMIDEIAAEARVVHALGPTAMPTAVEMP